MAYRNVPDRNMESVITELEECYESWKSQARNMSDRAEVLHEIIFKMTHEKSSIARNSCPDCKKQKGIIKTFLDKIEKLFSSKHKASGCDSELHKLVETLKCENEKLLSDLESYKRESNIKIDQPLKEKEPLLKDFDNKTDGNKELRYMTGDRKREFNENMPAHEDRYKILKDETDVKDLEIESLKENIKEQEMLCDKSLCEATENLEQQKIIISALESDKEQLKEMHEKAVRHKDEYLRINDETKKENKDLQKQIDLEIEKWNEIAAKLETNQEKFDQDIKERNEKYNQLVEKDEKMKKELDNLKTELKKCKRIKAEFESKLNDSEKEIHRLKQTLEAIEEDAEEKKKEMGKIREDNIDLGETLKQVTNKEQEYKSKIVELEERQKELQTTQLELVVAKNSAEKKMEMYKEDSIEWKTKYDDLQKQYIDIEKELQKELSKVKYFSEQEQRYKSEAEKKENQIQDLQTNIHHLKSDLEKSNAECKKLQNELEKLTFKPRKLIELGVFSSMKQKLTDIALSDLDRQLKVRLDIENTDLHLHPTVAQSDLRGPSIILCISISRLGADVQEALKGITASSQVAIIIFHHKEAHALPSQSSEKILTGPDYKQLGAIIDMAILSNKGIYNCVMNEAGLQKLLAFVRRF